MSSLSSSSRSLEHRGTGVVAAAALRAELDQVFQEVENKEALGVCATSGHGGWEMGKAPMVEWKITSWTMRNPNRISSKWLLELTPFEMVQFTWHIFREWFRQFGNSQIAIVAPCWNIMFCPVPSPVPLASWGATLHTLRFRILCWCYDQLSCIYSQDILATSPKSDIWWHLPFVLENPHLHWRPPSNFLMIHGISQAMCTSLHIQFPRKTPTKIRKIPWDFFLPGIHFGHIPGGALGIHVRADAHDQSVRDDHGNLRSDGSHHEIQLETSKNHRIWLRPREKNTH